MSALKKTARTFAFAAALCMAVFMGTTGQAPAQSSECLVDRSNTTVCPPAKTLCLMENNSGLIKCSPPDGGVIADRYGLAQCGTGRCVLDVRGDPFCSKSSGGAAAKGQYGDAVCSGGCERAQAAMCTTLRR